jgi:hypothetical protein
MEDLHTNNGGYDLEGVIWHQHSNQLMKKILEYFSKYIPVVDIGCGHNFYVSVLNHAGYTAMGCDLVDLGSKHFLLQDVTKPLPDPNSIVNVISLEVGEHLPIELSEGYLNNLTKFKGNVIMSWAIPGQEGIGHINCQPNEWVIDQMLKRGYKIDQQKTNSLREAVINCHCSWFRNTLMYFTCA